jgi:transposase
VTETLERVPAHWKVVEHVREKLACRKCDTIVQARRRRRLFLAQNKRCFSIAWRRRIRLHAAVPPMLSKHRLF